MSASTEISFGEIGGTGYDSFAKRLDVVRVLEEEGFDTNFRTETAADITNAGPMTAIAAAYQALFDSPVPKEEVADIDQGMSHMPATILAAQIIQPKAELVGHQWDHSEMANTHKFFDGQTNAMDKNDAKLESTEDATKILAETHAMLMGAAHDVRVDKYNVETGANDGPSNGIDTKAPSAGGIAVGAAAGWGTARVADALMPGLGAPIQMMSAAITGSQSAALAFGGGGKNYDLERKPRSKAEAAAIQAESSSGSYFSSGNNFDQSTSGGTIPSVTPRKDMAEYGASQVNRGAESELVAAKTTQIAMLEEAAAKVWDQGVEQSLQHDQAEDANDAHVEYLESGGADFDTHELFRAADKGMMNEVQQAALVVAAESENPDVAEKIAQRFELKDLDLTMGSGISAPRPT